MTGRYRAAGPAGPTLLEVAEHDGVVTLTMNGQSITGKVTAPGRAEGEEPGVGGGRFVLEKRGQQLAVRFTVRTEEGDKEIPEFLADPVAAPSSSDARDPAVVGRWRYTSIVFESAVDRNLELSADGTCTLFTARSSGREPAETGTWKTEGGRLYLRLDGDSEWQEKGRYGLSGETMLITTPSGQRHPYSRL